MTGNFAIRAAAASLLCATALQSVPQAASVPLDSAKLQGDDPLPRLLTGGREKHRA
jgi:hypothetical protein